ncbi:MAG: hypothetical protein QNJ88_11510 [Acidimicrobiia bacterium]|nr:hypothetical protein [Acidimicrobiia bacterium]
MTDHVEITGGAGPREAAAILAAVARVLQDEAQRRAQPVSAPRQSGWVLAWRPREIHAPLPSHTYDTVPWADTAQDETQD